MSQIYDKFALPIRQKKNFETNKKRMSCYSVLEFFHNRSHHKVIIVLVGYNSFLFYVEFMLHKFFFPDKQLLFSNGEHFLGRQNPKKK